MAGQYEILKCPFCDRGEISCLYFPSSVSIRQSRSRVIRGNTKVKSSEVWIVQSNCSICGRTKEEIEKELKNKNII